MFRQTSTAPPDSDCSKDASVTPTVITVWDDDVMHNETGLSLNVLASGAVIGFYLSELRQLKAVLVRISLQNVITMSCLCKETMGGQ